jgi:hypothetical protein
MLSPAMEKKKKVCKHKQTIKEYDGEYSRWICANEECDLTGHWFKDPSRKGERDDDRGR